MRSRASSSDWVGGLSALVVLQAACGGCPSSSTPDTAGADDACTPASCTVTCATTGSCSAGCVDGGCRCTDACGEIPDVPDVSDRPDGAVDGASDVTDSDAGEGDARDGDDGDVPDVDPDAGPCPYRASGETRAGASAGISCTRITIWENEYGALDYSGDGDRIVITGAVTSGMGSPEYIGFCLWEYRRSTDCSRIVRYALTPVGSTSGVGDPAIEGTHVAYAWSWRPATDTHHCLIGLLDLDSGEDRTLTSSDSRILAGGW